MLNIQTIAGSLTCACLALSSCTTVDPYTGETKTSNSAKAAAIGAISGGVIGALIGDNRTGGKSREYAIRGAALGALAGLGVGNYMDQQEAQIRQQLQGTGVSVTRSGDELILNMPSDITFKVNSSNLQQRFTSTLYSVALVLKKFNKTYVNVVGHTDSDGTEKYNMQLSVARARSVSNYLSRSGVSSNRIHSSGRGEYEPIASNSTQAGKAKNRRVQITIRPNQQQF